MLASACLLLSVAVCCPTNVIRTLAEVNALPESEFTGRSFELHGQVLAHFYRGYFILQDETGIFEVRAINGNTPVDGSLVTVKGETALEAETLIPILPASSIAMDGKSTIPEPEALTLNHLRNAPHGYRFVRTRGTVFDAFPDETDPDWVFVILKDGAESVCAALFDPTGATRANLHDLKDAEIEVVGFRTPNRGGMRIFTGQSLTIPDRSCITVIKNSPANPFDLPYLQNLVHVSPEIISAMGRRTVEGTVCAVWGGNCFLLNERNGRKMRIELEGNAALPNCGDHVKAVGFPRTDLFHLNLARAAVRVLYHEALPDILPVDTHAADVFNRRASEPKAIQSKYHGMLVRMSGEVRAQSANDDRRFLLDDDGYLVTVDISALAANAGDLPIGSKIRVTGVCIMNFINWHPNVIFPRIEGITLVPRKQSDIVIVSYPPWWTTTRLLGVIGGLLAVLIGILIWNKSLRKLAERRGRELYRSEIGKASAELRINERTRLAVELHDSIAQNLTGAFFQVEAADLARQTDPSALERCLKSAMQTIQSCREELRYCLWDLRNNVLDESDAADVLRRTLSPHVGTAQLTINADLPRSRISDNTFHTLLRIARELVSNAVRHGKAGRISVSARFKKATLVLEVTDDGIGFDPENRPGTDDGHFGLQGIEDRIRKMSGRLDIESRPGHGTRITVDFTPDQPEQA